MLVDNRPLIVKIRDENKAKLERQISRSQLSPSELSELKSRLKSKLRRNGLTLIKFHKKYLKKTCVSNVSFSGMLNTGGTKLKPEILKIIRTYLRSPDRAVKEIIPDNKELAELKYKLWRKLRFERADHIYFHKKYLLNTGVKYENFMSMMRPYGTTITPQVKNIVESFVNRPDYGY